MREALGACTPAFTQAALDLSPRGDVLSRRGREAPWGGGGEGGGEKWGEDDGEGVVEEGVSWPRTRAGADRLSRHTRARDLTRRPNWLDGRIPWKQCSGAHLRMTI